MKKMIWSIAWKNIWRNRVRSLVVIVAVVLGIMGGMLMIGFMNGLIEQRIDASIHNEISHVQIHEPEFMNNEEIEYTINNYDKIKNILDTLNGVVAYTARSKTFAMVQSDWSTTGLVIKGVNLEKEKQVSDLSNFIIEGDFLENESRLPSIVIGSKAAEELKLLNYQIEDNKMAAIDSLQIPAETTAKLDSLPLKRYRTEKQFSKALAAVLNEHEMKQFGKQLINYFSFYRLGAKVTVTISDTAQIMVPITFRVTGIYKTSNDMFDGMTAFVLENAVLKETGFGKDFIHEIAILTTNNEEGVLVAKELQRSLPNYSVLSWKQIAPDLAYMSDMMEFMDFIYVGIIMLALAFGIINTMLMAVLERAKELGMLMAIGMNKMRVFSMIMLESVFLTLTGAIVGMGASALIFALLARSGINLSMWSEGFEAMGYSAIIYPVVSAGNYINIILLVILTGILASIWPARKALKMNPAEALRTE
ncbi:MAG: FtsX-like permease family protein [Bacteroidales bacterium]|nr:FtsX-like permease family protein [Bacteroidales bacterium]